MGNNSTSAHLSANLIDAPVPVADDVFKVDNINSYGRKHAVAKIQVSNDSLCIRQKHRQSLYIPLETIKRYGLDGSIFILECGRRAPLGQARYAFRCKQARCLVDCIDQRILLRSKQLSEQPRRGAVTASVSALTNLSSSSRYRRRRTQSDHGQPRRAPSSVLFSSSSSASISFISRATFSYRNSVPNLSENYIPFDTLPSNSREGIEEEERQFVVKMKQPIEKLSSPDLNYLEFKQGSIKLATEEEDLSTGLDVPTISSEEESTQQSSVQQAHKRSLLSLFNHHQQKLSKSKTANQTNSSPISTLNSNPSTTTPYVYIDHEKTITLTEIANKRLRHQQQIRHVEV
ncbi:unnamed protein product [Adineta ricciae]|nr:unnamed protein product [Adineta ricciae]